jgi:hypothetical protein
MVVASGSLWAASAAAPGALSPAESRWLKGVWPVLLQARDDGLPLDVVVQPQPMPDAPPLAMAFIDGRCKLVFSMRGNPAVADSLRRIAPELLDASLELMAAHELGHCRRKVNGAWYGVPAGYIERAPNALAPAQRAAWADMQAVRREEGYADLVGLAWVLRRYPQHYARLYTWLLAERSNTLIAGSHHDTLAWVRRAESPTALAGETIFDAADALWPRGLADAD